MTTKNLYQNYFVSHYKTKFTKHDLNSFKKWFYSQFKFIKKYVHPLTTGHLLEIGCGFGGFFNLIKDADFTSYTGIDLDPDAIKAAKRFFPKSNFLYQSFEDFKSNTIYDRIFAFEVLEHLENPQACINKIYKKLSPSGIFIGTSPYPYPKNILGDKTHTYVLHPLNWKKLFREAGFSYVITQPMSFIPYIWRISPSLNIRLPFYISIKHFISTTLIIAYKEK